MKLNQITYSSYDIHKDGFVTVNYCPEFDVIVNLDQSTASQMDFIFSQIPSKFDGAVRIHLYVQIINIANSLRLWDGYMDGNKEKGLMFDGSSWYKPKE